MTLWLALCACAAWAQAGWRVLGEGRLDWFGLRIYEARLLVPPGFDSTKLSRHPFKLELTYRRSLRGADIARRSIEEMRRARTFREEDAAGWEAALARVIPDVKPGDRIMGVYEPGTGATFLVNDRPAGEIRDPEFAALFFGIWLAPTTSEPALRAALLGQAR